MPFGGGFGLDDRPFRPNRLLDFDDNPSMMGVGGHRGRGGRGGSRGHMRGRQGRFQHDRHYMAHNNRRLATNILGRNKDNSTSNSSDTAQQQQQQQNTCTTTLTATGISTSECSFVTKFDVNGNILQVCKDPNCLQLHKKISDVPMPNYHLDPLLSNTHQTPPPEYQSGPPSPNVSNNFVSSRHALTQLNNLRGACEARDVGGAHNNANNYRPTAAEFVDRFGKMYRCKSATNIVILALSVISFAVFLTLLALLT